jgi:hypothetical protein
MYTITASNTFHQHLAPLMAISPISSTCYIRATWTASNAFSIYAVAHGHPPVLLIGGATVDTIKQAITKFLEIKVGASAGTSSAAVTARTPDDARASERTMQRSTSTRVDAEPIMQTMVYSREREGESIHRDSSRARELRHATVSPDYVSDPRTHEAREYSSGLTRSGPKEPPSFRRERLPNVDTGARTALGIRGPAAPRDGGTMGVPQQVPPQIQSLAPLKRDVILPK